MYSGDTVYGKRLAKLFEVGAVGLDFCQTVQIAPYQSDSLVFHDAGEGAVHPGLNEIIALARKTESCVIPTHLETIPEHPESEFEPIIPGQTWEIIPQRTWQAGDLLRVLRTPILSEVGEDWLAAVVSLGALKEYSKGQTITAKGRTDKCVCVIISGNARVLDDAEEEIARLWSGDIFGEMAIMYGNPRNATVVAGSPVKVLELRGDIFLEMAKSTGLYDSLEAIHRTRPAFLRFPTIKNLPARVQNRIYSSARMMRAKAGETIIRQGDIGDSLYGIFKGKADVVLRGKTLATLYRGHLFGEIALLENGIRTADVVARTDVELFRISKDDFYVIVSNAPSFRYSLEMLIKNRNK
jgi:CRP-like cAMP-binding protein